MRFSTCLKRVLHINFSAPQSFQHVSIIYTLQGTNIPGLGKRKIIFKMPLKGDMLGPKRVRPLHTDTTEIVGFEMMSKINSRPKTSTELERCVDLIMPIIGAVIKVLTLVSLYTQGGKRSTNALWQNAIMIM